MDLKDCRCSHDSLKKLIQNSSKNKKKPLTPQEEKKWDKIIKKYDMGLQIPEMSWLNPGW